MDHFEDALIVSLILGIIISVAFIYITREEPEPFSEIYFLDHQNLPNEINLNQNYNFTTAIKSHEKDNITYEYLIDLELYNIYEVGYRDCFFDYRPKVYLSWMLANESDLWYPVFSGNDTAYQDLIAYQDVKYSDQYFGPDSELYIEYDTAFGAGELSILFGNGSINFGLTLDEARNMTYFQGHEKPYAFSGRHIVGIVAMNNTVRVFIDENLTYSEHVNLSRGRYWFSSHNAYFDIRRAKITNSILRDYIFDSNALTQMKSELFGMQREIIGMKQMNKDNENLYSMIFNWAGIDYNMSYTNYYLASDTKTVINFTDYTLYMEYEPRFGTEMMLNLYGLDNQTRYSLYIYDDLVFLLDYENQTIKITEKQIPIKENTVLFNITGTHMEIAVGDVLVFKLDNATTVFNDVSIDGHNTYLDVSKLIFRRKQACDFMTDFSLCYIEYRPPRMRSTGSYEVEANYTFDPSAYTVEQPSYIVDQYYQLDGRNARIESLENYSFSFDFQTLDGSRVVSSSFVGNTSLQILLDEDRDRAYLISEKENSSVYINLSEGQKHRVEVKYLYGIVDVILDYNKQLFSRQYNLSEGYYTIQTHDTYANLGGVTIRDDAIRRFDTSQDPCQLRRIYYGVIGQAEVFLDPGATYNIYSSFNITRDFDFGLVTAKLINQNLSIHFWLKR